MPCLVQRRDRIFVKGYGFLSFAKNTGKNLGINIEMALINCEINLILTWSANCIVSILKIIFSNAFLRSIINSYFF